MSRNPVPGVAAALAAEYRDSFRAAPRLTYKRWFTLQEQLRESGDDSLARALADDLWNFLPEIPCADAAERARFHHDLAVLFGSTGPAASLERALACFAVALAGWSPEADAGAHARALHNRGNALHNLGTTAAHLADAVTAYEAALEWRTETERPIARGATLQNLAMALRRLAVLRPQDGLSLLERSARTLRGALGLRTRESQPEAFALSSFQLGLTLSELSELAAIEDSSRPAALREADDAFADAERTYDDLGKSEFSALVRRERDRLPKV